MFGVQLGQITRTPGVPGYSLPPTLNISEQDRFNKSFHVVTAETTLFECMRDPQLVLCVTVIIISYRSTWGPVTDFNFCTTGIIFPITEAEIMASIEDVTEWEQLGVHLTCKAIS